MRLRLPGAVVALVGCCALALSLARPVTAAPEPPALRVVHGTPVFWSAPSAVTGDVADAGACTTDTCPTWPLEVAAGGHRLRVGVDTPSREDGFEVQLLDPSGEVAASAEASNQFNDEAFVADPVAGVWTVRVLPHGATDAPLRLRAGLDEGDAAEHPTGTPLLPNLRAVPPLELGFIAPANPLNGLYPPDDINPPLDVAGVHPISCAPDEAAPVDAGGQGAVKCLRLTTGPINVGEGPFDMRFDLVTDTTEGEVEPNTLRGPMRQAVHLAGGGIDERAAGNYSFHTTHGHFHTEQILTYELFSVASPDTGGLTKTGAGTKSGFCPADQLFGDFLVFQQAVPGAFGEGDTAAGNCSSPDGGSLGLTPGWGDVYRWQRPGQYVEFDGQPDGMYVIRSTVDKSNLIVESDDTDNTAYALARITGEQIELLERGQGTDPWDPRKTVFCGAGPASRDVFGPAITTASTGALCAASVLSSTVAIDVPAVAPIAAASSGSASAAAPTNATLPATGALDHELLLGLLLLSLFVLGRYLHAGGAKTSPERSGVSRS